MRALCVCLGNICRSPMMQGVLERAAPGASVDSAGLGGWHQGDPPDRRAIAAAAARGLDISGQRARRLRDADFHDFDLILTAEASQAQALRARAPAGARADIRAWLSFAGGGDVPDPYYGDAADFDAALDLIETAAPTIVARLIDGA